MSIFGSVMSRAVLRERCLRLRRSSKTNVEARLPYGIGSNRRENITDWALNEFRTHYSDPNITKWDIFHYVYAVLHHPEYRERYAANLKRELPRIPFVTIPTSPMNQPLGGGDMTAQHVAEGGVLGKAVKTPESPGDDTSPGHQPGSDTTGG